MPAPDNQPKRILVAPLDWGLGHATRCIPVIRELIQLGCEVLLGAEGRQAALLHEEFPRVTILPLEGYRIEYSPGASGFGMKMVKQLPRIKKAIRREKKWLKETITAYALDAVISDNRFGLHHPAIPCVIMTHQLLIKSPFGQQSEKYLQKVNYHYIKKFNACWVVDFEGAGNLAGSLSHPQKMPPTAVQYMGGLSRFSLQNDISEKYDVLALISGPEPQRTTFEKMILEQIRTEDIKALMVSGRPGDASDTMISDNVRMVSHLNSRLLNEAILQSGRVICRTGYTSVMDLVKLRKRAILVPTPGQTEQEYLGHYLAQKGYFPVMPQENFDLKAALEKAAVFPFHFPGGLQMDEYKTVVRGFVNSI